MKVSAIDIIEKNFDRIVLNHTLLKNLLRVEIFLKYLSKDNDLEALNMLSRYNLKLFLNVLENPKRAVYHTIFSPAEIFYAMDLNPLCLEGLPSVISKFGLEGIMIDEATKLGVSPTMCSFHRTLIGVVKKGILPKPGIVVATSSLCDGNLKSYELVAKLLDTDFVYLDVPDEDTEEAVMYLENQLKDLIQSLEKATKAKFDIDKLREVLKRANKTREYMIKINQLRKKDVEGVLKANRTLSFLYPSHVMMGSKFSYEFYKKLYEEMACKIEKKCSPIDSIIIDFKKFREKFSKGTPSVKRVDQKKQIRVLWLHLSPSYTGDLEAMLDDVENSRVIFEEINQVYWDEYDLDNPIRSIARKMISLSYNGNLTKRLNAIKKLAKEYNVDAIFHFNHWGCRQSFGAVSILKHELEKEGYKFLSVDGDCIDSSSYTKGQFKTRVESFLEILKKQKTA